MSIERARSIWEIISTKIEAADNTLKPLLRQMQKELDESEAPKREVIIHVRGGIASVGKAPEDVDLSIVDFDNIDDMSYGYVTFGAATLFSEIRSEVAERLPSYMVLDELSDNNFALDELSSLDNKHVETYFVTDGSGNYACLFTAGTISDYEVLEYLKDKGARFDGYKMLFDSILGAIKINDLTSRDEILPDLERMIKPVASFAGDEHSGDYMPAYKFLNNMRESGKRIKNALPRIVELSLPGSIAYVFSKEPVPPAVAKLYAEHYALDHVYIPEPVNS